MSRRRHQLWETAAWCVCLPAAAVPFSVIAALALLLVGIVVATWK